MKQGRIIGWFFCLGWLISSNSHAAAIGMPEQTARLGLAVGMANMTLDDPDGDAASEWVARPLNLIHSDHLFADYRYWAEAFYQDAVLPAATGEIGQRIKQLGGRFSIQMPLPISSQAESWLGAGLQLSRDSYDKRHTIDADGYLAQQYDDRSLTAAGLLLNFVAHKEIAGLKFGAKAEQAIPLGDGVREFSLSLIVLFSY